MRTAIPRASRSPMLRWPRSPSSVTRFTASGTTPSHPTSSHLEAVIPRHALRFSAMATDPTINDLRKQGLISDADVDAAVDTFMADPALSAFIFGDVCRLNLGAAVKAHRLALDALRDLEASPT